MSTPQVCTTLGRGLGKGLARTVGALSAETAACSRASSGAGCSTSSSGAVTQRASRRAYSSGPSAKADQAGPKAAAPSGGTPPPPKGPAPPPPGTGPTPGPSAGGAKKSRWAALGWAIPLIGLPAIAAWYNYEMEYTKEWDTRVALQLKEAVEALRASSSKALPRFGGGSSSSDKKPPAPPPQELDLDALGAPPPPPPTPPAPSANSQGPKAGSIASAVASISKKDGKDSASATATGADKDKAAAAANKEHDEQGVKPAASTTALPAVLDLNRVDDARGPDTPGAAAAAVLTATQSLEGDTVLRAAEDATSAAGPAAAAGAQSTETSPAQDSAQVTVTPELAMLLHQATDGLVSLPGAPATTTSTSTSTAPPSTSPSGSPPSPSGSPGAAESSRSGVVSGLPGAFAADVGSVAVAALEALHQAQQVPDQATKGAVSVPPVLAEAVARSGKELTPLGLVTHALKALEAAGGQPDWATFPHRHQQAVADASVLAEVLSQVEAWHKAEVAKVQGELERETARAKAIEEAGMSAVERLKGLLRVQAQSAQELMTLEVRQAEKRTALAAQQAALTERQQRLAELDEMRVAVNALKLAHEARVDMAAHSRVGHTVSIGAAALAAAAEAGSEPERALRVLAPLAGSDPLVGAVVGALPRGATPTRSSLESQLRTLKRDLAALSFFPGTSSGLLAHAVARVAGKLKLDESSAVRVIGVQGGGVDAALAQAEALVVRGDLSGAAELLASSLQGTAAAALAIDWVAAARRRAALDAAVTALNAHAAAMSASLA